MKLLLSFSFPTPAAGPTFSLFSFPSSSVWRLGKEMPFLPAAAAVAGIISCFQSAASLFTAYKSRREATKRHDQIQGQRKEDKSEAAEKSLESGPKHVQSEYDQRLALVGRSFAHGDGQSSTFKALTWDGTSLTLSLRYRSHAAHDRTDLSSKDRHRSPPERSDDWLPRPLPTRTSLHRPTHRRRHRTTEPISTHGHRSTCSATHVTRPSSASLLRSRSSIYNPERSTAFRRRIDPEPEVSRQVRSEMPWLCEYLGHSTIEFDSRFSKRNAIPIGLPVSMPHEGQGLVSVLLVRR